jgi:hypothetical protein
MIGDLIFTSDAKLGIGTNTPDYSIDITRTDAIGLPLGTTAQRPAPRDGALRFNTDTVRPEMFIDGDWFSISTMSDPNIDLLQQNILTVSKEPGEGQFSSVKSAVDSITNNNTNNRYLIRVNPGIYVEDTVQMKEFVSIEGVGLGSGAVVMEPDAPNKTILRVRENTSVNNILFRGATAPGARAVEGLDSGVGVAFINYCLFQNNAIHLSIRGMNGPSNVITRRCNVEIR